MVGWEYCIDFYCPNLSHTQAVPEWLRGFYLSLEEEGLLPEQLQHVCQLAALQHRAAEETEAPKMCVCACVDI